MSDQKNFFDMSSKQSLVMGLSWGIAIISVVALVMFLVNGQSNSSDGEIAGANTNMNANANVNTNTNTAPTPPAATGDVSKLAAVLDGAYSVGSDNAEVTLIEVSEFQCPYCLRHNPTMEKIMNEYKGKVKRVWIHFPLTSIHPYAMKAAEAVECAGEQNSDKFWEMHDKIFEDTSAMTVDDLKGYASEIGLNTSKFNSCLDDNKYTSKIQKQMAAAQAAGVSGTPGTFVNGQLVKGAYPFDTFKQLIDAELAK